MIAAAKILVDGPMLIAGSPMPVTPCGGCRQKRAEFGQGEARVTMATVLALNEVNTNGRAAARLPFGPRPYGALGHWMPARSFITATTGVIDTAERAVLAVGRWPSGMSGQ